MVRVQPVGVGKQRKLPCSPIYFHSPAPIHKVTSKGDVIDMLEAIGQYKKASESKRTTPVGAALGNAPTPEEEGPAKENYDRVTLSSQSAGNTPTLSVSVGFDAAQRAAELAGAMTIADVKFIIAKLGKDLSDVKLGIKMGACDKKLLKAVERLLNSAEKKLQALKKKEGLRHFVFQKVSSSDGVENMAAELLKGAAAAAPAAAAPAVPAPAPEVTKTSL